MEVSLKRFNVMLSLFTFNSFERRKKNFLKIFFVHLILLSHILPVKGKPQSLTFIELLTDAGRDEEPQQREQFFGEMSNASHLNDFFVGQKSKLVDV